MNPCPEDAPGEGLAEGGAPQAYQTLSGEDDKILGVSVELVLQLLFKSLVLADMTFALLVLVRYRQVWKLQHRQIPLHVLLISGSYYMLLAVLFTRTADWRLVFYVPALSLGIAAMVVMLTRPR